MKVNKAKLIPADKATEFPLFPLTQEQRRLNSLSIGLKPC